MAKFITRTITESIISVSKIEVEEGKPVIVKVDPIKVEGTVSVEKAQKEVSKVYGQGATVTAIEEISKQYRMEIAKFVELAEEVKAEDTEAETVQA